jgi:hypothetical protein
MSASTQTSSSVPSTGRLGSNWQRPAKFTERRTNGKAGRTVEKAAGCNQIFSLLHERHSIASGTAGKLGLEDLIGKRAGSPLPLQRDRPLVSAASDSYREKIIRHPLSSNSSVTTIKRQPHPQHEACIFIRRQTLVG